MITLEGYITTFEITPASTDDREGLKDIMDGKSGLVVLGDKGMLESPWQRKCQIRESALWHSNVQTAKRTGRNQCVN